MNTLRMKRYFEKYFESHSMYEAMSPLVAMGRQTGMIPFKYRIAPGRSETCLDLVHVAKNLIPATFYWSSFIVVTFLDWYKLNDQGADRTYIYGEKLQIYSGFISLHCMICFTFIKMDNLATNFQLLNEIDKLFESLGCTSNFTRQKKMIFVMVILLQVIYMTYMLLVTYLSPLLNSAADLPLLIVKNSPTYFTNLMQCICSSLIFVSVVNLRVLNGELKKISRKLGTTGATGRRPTGRDVWQKCDSMSRNNVLMQMLDLVWKAYAKICHCTVVIDEYFSMTMFAIIAGSFLVTLFQVFHLMSLAVASAGGSHIPWEMISLVCVQSAMSYGNMFTVILICNMAEDEAKETSRLVNNMMAEEMDLEISDKLHLMSTHMLHIFPKFSAAGLFPINNSLHFTIVGAMTTYMVILYQFSAATAVHKYGK